MSADFTPYGKTPRLNRPIVITEKVDGTNAGIRIEKFPFGHHVEGIPATATAAPLGPFDPFDGDGLPVHEYRVTVQSRNRIITPNHDGKSTDNAGFAAWVLEHAATLVKALGEGMHSVSYTHLTLPTSDLV